MKKLLLYALVILASSYHCTSQNSINHSIDEIETIETNYLDYFDLTNETIFTHLNKSIYFKDEELWFKTYIYNTKNHKPYASTTNVYASIYDIKGKLLFKKLYYANSGFTNGNFKLDSLFSPGIYFLKTDTNWMKNFNEDASNIQKFEIVESSPENNLVNYSENSYDFQLLAEGGHLVNDVINTIGFKILDSNGKSTKIVSGKVFDNNNNLITTFNSNDFGLGKFEIKIEKGKEYFSQVTLENGEIITNPLPKADETGISLNVIGVINSKLTIILRTNEISLNLIADKTYFLLVHRDGLLKNIKINFTKDKFDYLIRLPQEDLFSGINILTLFNDLNQPIAERIVYNNTITPIKSVFVSKIIKGKDSTFIQLSTNIDKLIEKNLSISVLPSSTVVSNDNSSIISTFLLSPYVKGEIENPRYYFDNTDRKTLYDLDLLLLTQGWSKYSWYNIFNNPPRLTHDFETGFNIIGSLNKYRHHKNDRLLLSSKENLLHIYSNIEDENHFNFKNLFLTDSTDISFGIEKESGELIKPIVYFNVFPLYIVDSLNINTLSFLKYQKKEGNNEMNNYDMFLSDSINLLNVVTLKNVVKKNKPKNKILGIFGAKYIDYSNANNPNSLITDEIRRNGFKVFNDGFNVDIYSLRGIDWQTGFNIPATVILNDNVLLNSSLSIISNLRVFEVEEMYVNKGSSVIYNSTGGVIHIFTKTGISYNTYNNKKVLSKSKVNFGFSLPEEYYSPKYDKSKISNFSKYGVIQWVPNLTMDDNGELSFKTPNYSTESINLYIEGMAEDGSLFSKIETIKI